MEIHSFQGLGVLRFGQSREMVREILGGVYRSFTKALGSTNETDASDELGLHLFYDDSDRLEFIEGFGSAILSFQGIEFLGRDLAEIENRLEALGYTVERSDAGLQSDTAGISIYAPGGVVEAVSVFRQGYYDT